MKMKNVSRDTFEAPRSKPRGMRSLLRYKKFEVTKYLQIRIKPRSILTKQARRMPYKNQVSHSDHA